MERSRRWLLLVYGSLAIPVVGPSLIIVASFVTYYVWRRRFPERDRWLIKHAWIAIGLNVLTNVAWLLAFGR
jgi:hypothetical protein